MAAAKRKTAPSGKSRPRCKQVKFTRSRKGARKFAKPKEIVFCKKEATPAEKSGKAFRAMMVLKAHACAKPSELSPALKKACRSRKLPSSDKAAQFFKAREAGKRVGII